MIVNETATYIDVLCDGYVLRIYFGSGNASPNITFTPGAGQFADIYLGYMREEGGILHGLNYDDDSKAIVLRNTPTSVIVKLLGNLKQDDQTVLTNSKSYDVTFYLYEDRFVTSAEWVIEGGTIDIDENIIQQRWCDLITNSSNPAPFWEEAGSEEEGDTYEIKDDAKYIGFHWAADACNIMGVDLYHTDDAYFHQYIGTGRAGFEWDNVDAMAVGIHKMAIMWIIDSEARENDGGTFLDWDTDIDGVLDPVPVGTICNQATDGLRYICHTEHTPAATNEPGVGGTWTDFWHEYRMILGNQYQKHSN